MDVQAMSHTVLVEGSLTECAVVTGELSHDTGSGGQWKKQFVQAMQLRQLALQDTQVNLLAYCSHFLFI